MASLKAEKPVESQSSGQVKKEPAKPSGSTPKAPSSKPAPKKTQKRSRPKQKMNSTHALDMLPYSLSTCLVASIFSCFNPNLASTWSKIAGPPGCAIQKIEL
ncbi:hypothetical protein glysoja_033104 [Glycine soja]|uniref:Uncharacterized protein n=1 Tax=Glycine soja TaxID=3848 RepID=A0A0B2PJ37_GLYSO|nr:hypothetical protein glysoja_033104 [Glycine soja]